MLQSHRFLRTALLVTSFGALGGCGEGTETPDAGSIPADGGDGSGGSPDAGVAPTIEVGTGIDAFEDFVRDGSQIFPLVLGPQGGGRLGGHHVALAVRLNGLEPADFTLLTVRVLDANGAERTRLSRAPTAPFINGRDLPNLAPRVDDCCLVAEAPVTVEATVTLLDGSTLEDRVSGRATTCPQPSQGPSLCP